MPKKFGGANGEALRLNKEIKANEFSRNLAEFDRLTNSLLKRLDLLEEFLIANDKEKSEIRIYSVSEGFRHNAVGETPRDKAGQHPSRLLRMA
jgi:hypothetical protein